MDIHSESPIAYIDTKAYQFIVDQLPDLAAGDVVRQARDAGFHVSLEQVHFIRARERAREQARARAAAPAASDPTPADEGDAAAAEPPDAADRPRRGRKPGGTDTKAGFVRSLPAALSVKEVVERARQHGFEVTEAYVYTIRSKAKASPAPAVVAPAPTRRAPRAKAPPPPPPPAPAAVAAPDQEPPPAEPAPAARGVHRTSATSVREVELELARLMLAVGLVRTEQVLVQLKTQLAALVVGPEPGGREGGGQG